MTPAQRSEFEALVRPLIKWLNDHANPHSRVLVDVTSAELVDGSMVVETEEYLHDPVPTI